MEIVSLWSFETQSRISGCPGIVGGEDGPLVIVGTDDGDVIALDGSGAERWCDHAGAVMQGWPAVVDLPAGRMVLIGDHTGCLHAYAPDGAIRWRMSLGDLTRPELFASGISPWSGVAVLQGADPAAIVVTDRTGQVSALTGDGERVWRAHLAERGVGLPAVGDLDGDGADEIVISDIEGRAYCLAADGTFRWGAEVMPAEGGYHAPLVVDWGEGPRVLIIGEREGVLRCLDGSGREVWRNESGCTIGVQIGIAPLHVNGEYRFFIAWNKTGQCILSTDGTTLWRGAYSGGSQPFGPSVADVDGDGRPEVLMTRRECPTLWILDADGREKVAYDMGGAMDGAPVIADMDGDGVPEFLIVNVRSGRVTALRVRDAVPGGAIQWPTSRGPFDGRRSILRERPSLKKTPQRETGRMARLAREEPITLRTGRRPIRYAAGGLPPDAVIQTEVTGPDGARHLFIRRLDEAEHGSVEALEEGAYHLRARAYTSEGAPLAEGSESLAFVPFTPEREEGERLLADLDGLRAEIASSDGDAAQILARRVQTEREYWRALCARMDDPEEDRRELATEVKGSLVRLRTLLHRQRRAQEYRAAHGGPVEMLPWNPGHPWVLWSPREDVPPEELLGEIRVTTEQNAHEATVIEIANVRDGPLSVRVWVDRWQGEVSPESDALVLRQQIFVPTARGNTSPDALPALDEAGVLTIPADQTARIWLDWSAHGLPPGRYTTTLHVRALTVPGQVWDVPLVWEVLSLSLPERSPLWFHMWAYRTQPLAHLDEETVYRDLLDHHVNVFDLPVPRAVYDADGRLGPIDWSATDRVIELLPPGVFFLWSGREDFVRPAEGAPPIGSAPWRKAFCQFVTQWVEHLAAHGIDYDHHANYIIDEPGIEGGRRVETVVRVARLFKEVDPRIKIFTNPAGGATPEHIAQLLEVADIFDPIWQYPGEYVHLRTILDRAKVVWTYACAEGAKDRRRMDYYWAPIWKGAELGLTGIGFWSYAGRAIDLWQGPVPHGCDWELVYQGARSVVPSHRWQGLRIGVEDYARLWMVQRAADRARTQGDTASAEHLERQRNEVIRRVIASNFDEGTVAWARAKLRELLMRAEG